MEKVWMIASGKGGTGKTTLAASLGVAFAKQGKKVCVVDACAGLKGIDLLLGMENRVVYDAFDVARQDCTLEQALIAHETYPNLFLLSTSQIETADSMKPRQFEHIIKKLTKRFDIVLIDCPSGTEEGVMCAAEAADACILTITPDDAALRSAEKLSAMLFEKSKMQMYLAVNGVNEKMISEGLMMQPQQFSMVLDAPLLGELPAGEGVYRATLQHKTPLETGEKHYTSQVLLMISRMQDEDAAFKTYRVRRRKWFHHAEG